MGIRINKYLAESGATSRRGGDAMVEAGRVTVDGRKALMGEQVEAGSVVMLDGKVIAPSGEKYYLLFNKPVGIITTTDPASRDNIMDALVNAGWPLKEKRVFPIGRLDVASSGLILITNDSEVGERMLRKEGGHEKEYLVTINKPLGSDAITAWTEGMEILGQKTLPAVVRKLKPDHFSITIVQGLNRQIRRMCEAFHYEVVSLKRVRILHLHLDTLEPGKYREMTKSEIDRLRGDVGLV